MRDEQLPLVSALTATYNCARYLPEALDSALGQDYPPDKLELVVIDDGSEDETAEILREYQAKHPRRIRAYRQANAGLIPATNHAMREARGELLAILDADDTWLEHKTRRQVELLQRRPEVGLVHGDMLVTDSTGAVTHPSLHIHHYGAPPPRGRLLAQLMAANHATASSVMVRARLRRYFDPIPEDSGITGSQDWWLAARTALAAEIDYLSEPCATYRIHGGNASAGACGAGLARELCRELRQQRWFLEHVEPEHELSIDDLVFLFDALAERAMRAIACAGSPFVELLAVGDDERRRAQALLSRGQLSAAVGDHLRAAVELIKAFAADPYDMSVRQAFRAHAAALQTEAAQPQLAAARGFRTLAFAGELIDHPHLLTAYASQFSGAEDASLVILVPEREDLARLSAIVAQTGLEGQDAADLVAVTAPVDERALLPIAHETHAVLSARPSQATVVRPHFTAQQVGALKRLAQRWWNSN
jgi:hypothetical protein